MPTYDYRCENCSHEFVELRKVDDRDAPTKEPCPMCRVEGEIVLCIMPVAFGDAARLGVKKACGSFYERMQEIKRKTRSSIQRFNTKK